MKNLLPVILMLFAAGANAQYYYKDIISNKQLLTEMASYRENKIRTVSIKSFEDDGSPSEGFFCQKKISKDYRKAELFTRSNLSGPSLFTSLFNSNGQVLSTHDSSDISVTNNIYSYDENQRIHSILSSVRSQDDDFVNEILEEHIYYYDAGGQPEKMIRVKNRTDSTIIMFAKDDNNNIAIEKDTKNASKYYYYYDAKNRLTDVVHSNDFKTKLLPDYLFEYNAAGLTSQMTATEEGGNYYFIWKYAYENGLRIREKCYSKEKRLMGTIEYEYK
ncbi:MAG TPA: hypothetical protein VK498_02425 [Ferruginibacter sp.]|nr:hypothetical protein [Ferruginibacter sp.]